MPYAARTHPPSPPTPAPLRSAGLGDLAATQRGVVHRVQCLTSGMSDDMIRTRVASGRWQRLFTGVFATFSGPVDRMALFWAALLRAGEGAVLSHQSAAELVGLLARSESRIHVTIPATRRIDPVPGLVVHRSRRLGPARHPTRQPAQTRIEETVIDLTQSVRDLDSALSWLATACGQRLTTADRLARALRRRNRVKWRRELLDALDDVAAGCHSLLELRYLRDVERRHGLPRGVRQKVRPREGGRWYDDVRYDRYATLVELDGRAAHPEESRHYDRRRDNAAVLDGFAVLRYGTADVVERACETAWQIGLRLRRSGWTGDPAPCGSGCRGPRLPVPS